MSPAGADETVDVLVLGGGVAAAALVRALGSRGVSTATLDDPLHSLPAWAASHPAQPVPETLAWQVTSGFMPGFTADCLSPSGRLRHVAAALVLPVTMRERLLPFPGCSLPGVGGIGMTVSAGERVLVAGPSPWREAALAAVAAAGAVAVPAPVSQHVAVAEAAPAGLNVRLADAAGETVMFAVERLMAADGWLPATDVFRLLRAVMVFDPTADAWLPQMDASRRTSVPLLYVLDEGSDQLAATIAADLSAQVWPHASPPARATPARDADPGRLDARVAALEEDAIICPCEGIVAGQARGLVAAGLREINQLKSATRCGMGPCGGRLCEDVAARVLAHARGCARAEVGYWTGRAPLVPVALSTLIGDYAYGDIPLPAAAPL